MQKKASGTMSPKIDTKKVEEVLDNITAEDVKSVSKVDYLALKKRLDKGEVLFAVKNTADIPLIQDWNLDLLPEDIEEDFNKYLETKYVQYELSQVVKGHRVVALYYEGRTVNFLNNYLDEKTYPLPLPVKEGKEVIIRSSFLLNSGDTVILTEKQTESLRRFEKIKHTWSSEGKRRSTDWLGFLTMRQVKDSQDLFKYDISYVTSEDVKKTHKPLVEGKQSYSRREPGIIREEE